VPDTPSGDSSAQDGTDVVLDQEVAETARAVLASESDHGTERADGQGAEGWMGREI
jgi:hypothetical protein